MEVAVLVSVSVLLKMVDVVVGLLLSLAHLHFCGFGFDDEIGGNLGGGDSSEDPDSDPCCGFALPVLDCLLLRLLMMMILDFLLNFFCLFFPLLILILILLFLLSLPHL